MLDDLSATFIAALSRLLSLPLNASSEPLPSKPTLNVT